MSGRWSFYVNDRPWDGSRELYMRVAPGGLGGRHSFVVGPLTVVTPEPGAPYDIPTLKESREDTEDNLGDVTGFLQAALEAAWDLGMRPRAYADHTSELKAVRYHLEDMRSLAFKGMG